MPCRPRSPGRAVGDGGAGARRQALRALVLAAAGFRASTKSTGSAALRRSRRWPTAQRRSRRSGRDRRPGNAYVAVAKRLVFGMVGIDMIAGPSEVLILADRTGNPDWIAADLLAQAEHDASAQSILITDDPDLARDVEAAVDAQLKSLPRVRVAEHLARFRRDHRRRRACRGGAAGRRHRAGASRDRERECRGSGAAHTQCRRHFSGAAHARGDRRLRRRFEPCVADRAFGPLLLGARGAGFHGSGRRSSNADPISCARLPPLRSRWARPGLDAHARSVAMRLNR